MPLVRLHKILADAGVASRRASEELILDGRVSVDGVQITELGYKADPEIVQVEVDGEAIRFNKSKTYLAFYKPAGILSTMSDPEGRANLSDFFQGRNDRLFHVGRLDKESEGLILLTNDGDITHRATHPSYGLVKRYLVELEGTLTKGDIEVLLKGVELEDGMARALDVKTVREISQKHSWAEVSIHEGRYHIVRRMFMALELPVVRLIRTDFGPISIGDLKEGRWRNLNEGELVKLFSDLKLKR
jgi:23S rRNA pseudouridine2605 synthase